MSWVFFQPKFWKHELSQKPFRKSLRALTTTGNEQLWIWSTDTSWMPKFHNCNLDWVDRSFLSRTERTGNSLWPSHYQQDTEELSLTQTNTAPSVRAQPGRPPVDTQQRKTKNHAFKSSSNQGSIMSPRCLIFADSIAMLDGLVLKTPSI